MQEEKAPVDARRRAAAAAETRWAVYIDFLRL